MLDHNFLLIATTLPYVKFAWNSQQRRAAKRREHPYAIEIADPYRKSKFPMWVGFLWKPRYSQKHPITFESLKAENRNLHAAVRAFYADKDPALAWQYFYL